MVKNVTKAFPNRQLRAARKAHGWTQSEVAELIGAPSSLNVTRWERGTTLPSAFYLKKLCQLFEKTPQELGLSQEEQKMPEEHEGGPDTISFVPLWNVLYRRNLFFTGREEVLLTLHESFAHAQRTTPLPAYALSGLGGIGKTQLALEYAYRFRQHYHAVFWVRAASQETLQADFSSLASLLALPQSRSKDQSQIVAAVKHWLSTHDAWLLILDNADDLSLLSDFLPTSGEGHLLLTTRATATGTLASRLAVERMEPEEGALFLLRRSKLLMADAALASIEPPLREHAYALVALLDGLPLALDQAGAYLEETGCSLQEYIELYQQSRMTLLDRRGSVLSDYPYTVASTWLLSLQQVEQQSPVAAELLRLLALLDPDAIAESLLCQGASLLGPVLGPIAADPFLLNEAIQVLRRFSLVQRHATTQSLSLHRLVQVVIQEEMDIPMRHMWIERVIALLNAVFLTSDTNYIFQNISWFLELLPHVLVSVDLMERFQVFTLDGAHLLAQAIGALATNYRQNVLAERLSLLALKIYEQQDMLESPEAAFLFRGLGLIACTRGRFDQALSLHQRALKIQQRILGNNDIGLISNYNNLGLVHWALAHYDQAKAMYQQALTICERALGPEHIITATVLTNLGDVAFCQKHYTQAEHLHQQALAILERDDPHNLALTLSLSNMGSVYSAQRRYDKAEKLLLRALTLYEQGSVADFILAGRTFSILGELYHVQGRYTEAKVAYDRAVAIFAQEPDLDHPVIAHVFAQLATLSVALDHAEEADALYQQALGIYTRGVGMKHPEAVKTQENYMALLSKANPSEESHVAALSSNYLSLKFEEHDPESTSREVQTMPAIESLTRREREMLRFLAQGLTNAQIAQELKITVHTVNTHLRSIYQKLNITTRSGATCYAFEHQLL